MSDDIDWRAEMVCFKELEGLTRIEGAQIVALAGSMMEKRQERIFTKVLFGRRRYSELEAGDREKIKGALSAARQHIKGQGATHA